MAAAKQMSIDAAVVAVLSKMDIAATEEICLCCSDVTFIKAGWHFHTN